VIVLAVRWYLRFGLSYRDVEELLAERSVEVDHVTVYRWVGRFTPLLADAARPCRHAVGDRWQVDETYPKVAGQWRYVYRAIDQFGQVIDVFVSQRRDARAARRFFERAVGATRCTPSWPSPSDAGPMAASPFRGRPDATPPDRMVGLDLDHLAVDGCITKTPCGGQVAGRSPVDRGKQGGKRSLAVEGGGIPLGVIAAPANRRDDGLLAATLDTMQALGPLPDQPTVHLDAGYDYQPCRAELARRGMAGRIATRGMPVPVQVGRR
jgi:hypothetical protein